MTVAQLIKFLKTQDQNATVRVVDHKDGHTYYDQGGNAYEVDFKIELHVEVLGPPYNTILLGRING